MTAAESTNYARRDLQKANEYLASAQDNLDLERATPAAGDAIHTGISGSYCGDRKHTSGGKMKIAATGPSFGFTFGRSSAGGSVKIYVDGTLKGSASFRSSGALTFGFTKVVSGLSNTRHKIVLKFTGAGYVDDLVVTGPVG